jgi:hypothetical protein
MHRFKTMDEEDPWSGILTATMFAAHAAAQAT